MQVPQVRVQARTCAGCAQEFLRASVPAYAFFESCSKRAEEAGLQIDGTLRALSRRMGARTFREVIAWQLARELRQTLRPFWCRAESARDYGLCEQLRDAARSVTSNIAEWFPCSHVEYARFLEIASRSLEEIEDRLIEMVDDELVSKSRTGVSPQDAHLSRDRITPRASADHTRPADLQAA